MMIWLPAWFESIFSVWASGAETVSVMPRKNGATCGVKNTS